MTRRFLTAAVLHGRQSVVRDEAENRRHALTAVPCWLISRPPARSW
jgi:hypothetical protein